MSCIVCGGGSRLACFRGNHKCEFESHSLPTETKVFSGCILRMHFYLDKFDPDSFTHFQSVSYFQMRWLLCLVKLTRKKKVEKEICDITDKPILYTNNAMFILLITLDITSCDSFVDRQWSQEIKGWFLPLSESELLRFPRVKSF